MRHFIKANTRRVALGSTIKEYYLGTATTVMRRSDIIYGAFQRSSRGPSVMRCPRNVRNDRENNPRGRESRKLIREIVTRAMLDFVADAFRPDLIRILNRDLHPPRYSLICVLVALIRGPRFVNGHVYMYIHGATWIPHSLEGIFKTETSMSICVLHYVHYDCL